MAIAVAITAVVFTSTKSAVVLLDGDSQLPLLWRASIWAGQPQDWILSSPLFLVELILYGPAALIPLPNAASMALFSVIGWFALYVAARSLTAAAGLRPPVGVVAALGIVAVPGVQAMFETSADRNALELSALLSTTTYYSGSLIGTVFLLALVVRSLRQAPSLHPGILAGTVALTCVSTLSNPLFLAWTVGPLAAIVIVLGIRGMERRATVAVVIALTTGAAAGMLARIPFASVLVQDNLAKVRPDLRNQSMQYYLELVAARLANPVGQLAAALILLAIAIAIIATVIALRSGRPAIITIASFAVLSPVIITIASVLGGTFAARYLQPLVFFPPLAIAAIAQFVAVRHVPALRSRRRVRGIAVFAVLAISALLTSATISLKTATVPDASLRCAVDWINHRNAPGAGQYWSVRAVKAALSSPLDLIQTDEYLNGYSWLTNADDYREDEVFFTITDNQSPPFISDRLPTRTVECGRYTIDDFGDTPLRVGPPHH